MTFTLSEVDKIDVLFTKFKDYCKPRKNVIIKRYKFNIRVQRKDKTADQYATVLKLIAKNYKFGSLEDELIRVASFTGTSQIATARRGGADFKQSFEEDMSCG